MSWYGWIKEYRKILMEEWWIHYCPREINKEVMKIGMESIYIIKFRNS